MNSSVFPSTSVAGCVDCQDTKLQQASHEPHYGFPNEWFMRPVVLLNKIPVELPEAFKIGRDFLCPAVITLVGNVLTIDGTSVTLPAPPAQMVYQFGSSDGSATVTTSVAGNTTSVDILIPPVVIPPLPSFCTQFQAGITAAGAATALQAGDQWVVKRGANCVVVDGAAALVDHFFKDSVFSYNPLTGVLSMSQVDETGNPQTVMTVTIAQSVETPLVVTSPNGTVVIGQSGTNGHTLELDVNCAASAAPAVLLCPGATFIGCGGQQYTLPAVCAQPTQAAGGAVALTETEIAAIAAGAAGGVPVGVAPSLGAPFFVDQASGSSSYWPDPYSISFTVPDTKPVLLMISQYMGGVGGTPGYSISITGTLNGTTTVLDSRIRSSGPLDNRMALWLVQPAAAGLVTINIMADRLTHWLYRASQILGNPDPATPIGPVTALDFNQGGGAYTSFFAGGGNSNASVTASTRNGVPATQTMAAIVIARHLLGIDGAGVVNQPPTANNQGSVSEEVSTTPNQGLLPKASLSLQAATVDIFTCPQSIQVLNNPANGLMSINSDPNGFGTVYYVPLNQETGPGGAAVEEIAAQTIVLASTNCGNCCVAKNALVHLVGGTLEVTQAPGSIYDFKFSLAGRESTLRVQNAGSSVKTEKLSIPELLSRQTVECGTGGLDVEGAVELTLVNYVADPANAIALSSLTVEEIPV